MNKLKLKLNLDYIENFVSPSDLASFDDRLNAAYTALLDGSGKGNDFIGWRDLPINYDKDEFARIKLAAEKIKKNSDVLLVIGIGGSYLGARAAIEFLKSPFYNNMKKDTPDVYFLGCSISSDELYEVMQLCEGRDVSVNVISKSGTTTEPAIAFRIIRGMMEKKYSKDELKERIFITTDKCRGTLKSFADREGYETFVVPDDVGGRFSVLTAVGLLPIAVCGIDIDKIMLGAQNARADYLEKGTSSDACKYAAVRNALYQSGKKIELLCSYESAFRYMTEWWKQLYGESEGKDGLGIFPASVVFTTDLHSMGQYIQDGERTLFETVVMQNGAKNAVNVPFDEENLDGLNFIAEMPVTEVNKKAFLGTLLAHNDGGVPNIVIEYETRDEETFGEMVYFFEFACGISAYILDVNPFNQPGVEAYKKNMFALLGKPGYEELGKELRSRIENIK